MSLMVVVCTECGTELRLDTAKMPNERLKCHCAGVTWHLQPVWTVCKPVRERDGQ